MNTANFGSEVQPGRQEASEPERAVELSVVVPVTERWDDLPQLFLSHARELAAEGRSWEMLFVLDGPHPELLRRLTELEREHPQVRIVVLNRSFGEAAALSVGFAQARGETILTLASYPQVEPQEIRRILERLARGDVDLVVSRRHPRIDAWFNRSQASVFHWIVRRLTGTAFNDISCGLRGMRRRVVQEVELYGDLHRFLPILAYERGFAVAEIDVRQSPVDAAPRVYGPGLYLRRMLDILTLFFLFKFTRKPLRFFGLIGTLLGVSGVAITGYLGAYRLLGLGSIAGRPLLILGVLLLVLGVQLFSIGLLGEIIIFTHGRGKDYTVDRFLE